MEYGHREHMEALKRQAQKLEEKKKASKKKLGAPLPMHHRRIRPVNKT